LLDCNFTANSEKALHLAANQLNWQHYVAVASIGSQWVPALWGHIHN